MRQHALSLMNTSSGQKRM